LVPSDSTNYSAREITNIDDVEKSKLPLYTTRTFREGLYATFHSFKNQIPDGHVSVKMKKDEIQLVSQIGDNGKEQNVDSRDIYALVYRGLPYIAVHNNYYKIYKEGSDFFFVAEGKLYLSPVVVVTTGSFFSLLTRFSQGRSYLMKIDHASGAFKQVKEVDKTEQ
jgi:hypothetical protein